MKFAKKAKTKIKYQKIMGFGQHSQVEKSGTATNIYGITYVSIYPEMKNLLKFLIK